jgi:hypothetical protein
MIAASRSVRERRSEIGNIGRDLRQVLDTLRDQSVASVY